MMVMASRRETPNTPYKNWQLFFHLISKINYSILALVETQYFASLQLNGLSIV